MDIFKWITGQLPVPERVDNEIMRELQASRFSLCGVRYLLLTGASRQAFALRRNS